MPSPGAKALDSALAVFFALFAFSCTFSIAVAQSSFAVSLLLFLIVIVIRRYNPLAPRLRIFYLFVGLYVAWMLLAAVLGKTPMRSIEMIKEEWLFLIVPVGIYLCENDLYRNWLFKSLVAGVILFSLYGILQHFTGFHWPKSSAPLAAFDYGYLVKGTFSNPLTFGNFYGTAAAFMAAFTLTRWGKLNQTDRWLSTTAAVLAVAVTVFSHSRGPILGLIAALVILGLILKKRWFTYSLVIALIGAVVFVTAVSPIRERILKITYRDVHTTDPGGRPFIWRHTLEIIGDHPVFGVGEGNFYQEYADRLPPDTPEYRKYAHAHDDLLNVAAMSGIPGMLFFLGMWVSVFALCWKGWHRGHRVSGLSGFFAAGLIGGVMFFLSSITEATFADEEVRELLMLIWAFGLWQLRLPEREKLSEAKADPRL